MSRWKVIVLAVALSMLAVSTASSQIQFARALDFGLNLWPGRTIVRTSDGGYGILLGISDYGAGSEDILVVKIDDVGRLSWATTIGWDGADYPCSIVEDDVGGLLLGGITNSVGAGGNDLLLVKLDASGNVLGSKTLGWTSQEHFGDLIRTADGGYALIGSTDHLVHDEVLFVKLNGGADPQYSQIMQLEDDLRGHGVALMQTPDLGYAVLASTTSSPFDDHDVLLSKLNVSGGHMWSWKYGGASEEYPQSFVQTEDNGWVIVGRTESFGSGMKDILMMRVSSLGGPIWTRAIGGALDDEGYEVIRTTMAFAVAGQTVRDGSDHSDALLGQFDNLWNLTSFWVVGGASSESAYSAARATHGGSVTVGIGHSYGTGTLLLKYDNNGETCVGESISLTTIIVYPESETMTPSITYVAPTLLYHTPVVTHPDVVNKTICRDPVTIGDADFSGSISTMSFTSSTSSSAEDLSLTRSRPVTPTVGSRHR